jgi:DNA sulfur modification protein DndE
LKFNRLKLSTFSQSHLSLLKKKTGLTANIIGRFAICLSLKDPVIPNPDEYNKGGFELTPQVLFGEHEELYMALMLHRLKKDSLDPELYLDEMTRAHLNRGVIAIFPRINHLSDFYELVKEERNA